MSKTTYHLPRCTCGHLARYYRSTGTWKCCYCPATFTPKEAEALYDVPEVEEQTFDIDSPVFDMFKNPSPRNIIAPQAMAAPTPVTAPVPVSAPTITAPTPVKVEPIDAIVPVPDTSDDVVIQDIWAPSEKGQPIDIDQLFRYQKKDEPKMVPPRFKMPVMASCSQPAQAQEWDTGRQVYSLRSER